MTDKKEPVVAICTFEVIVNNSVTKAEYYMPNEVALDIYKKFITWRKRYTGTFAEVEEYIKAEAKLHKKLTRQKPKNESKKEN